MKAMVLKPIVWNTISYVVPSGVRSASGFAEENGYGHEEWNNNPKWIWQGFKVFHTEAPNSLFRYSTDGSLGMIMTASHDSLQYAVGVATNVFNNSEADRKLIAEELGLYENWKDVWKLPNVQTKFKGNRSDFLSHWKRNYEWVLWKTTPDNYYWFKTPIQLNPYAISKKQKLASMHGRYQGIDARKAIQIISKGLPNINHSCLRWLKSGDFDEAILKGNQTSTRTTAKRRASSKGPAPTGFSYQYWVEGNRRVEPLHASLQSRFVISLKKRKITFKENVNNVDVQYDQNGKTTFCEIKPTENVPTKYAIRFAVGQLLEYRHINNLGASLEIVIGNEPSAQEASFVASLGIHLCHWNSSTNSFKVVC